MAVIILIYRGTTQLWSLFKVLEIVSSREKILHPAVSVFVFFNHLMNLVKFSSQLKNKLLQKFPIWVLESERMDLSVKNRVRVVPTMKPRQELISVNLMRFGDIRTTLSDVLTQSENEECGE